MAKAEQSDQNQQIQAQQFVFISTQANKAWPCTMETHYYKFWHAVIKRSQTSKKFFSYTTTLEEGVELGAPLLAALLSWGGSNADVNKDPYTYGFTVESE